MRIRLAALALLVAVLGAWLWLSRAKTRTVPPQESAAQQDAAVAKALVTANPQAAAVISSNFASAPSQTIFYSAPRKPPVAPAGKPEPLEFTNLAPDIVLDYVRLAIRCYGSMFTGNPVGVNSEITSQLNGQNPKQANLIRPEAGMRINDQGELVDPWGTPYFFHQLSGTEMEIRSAGPDKTLWTADDLVTK
jgi:hypothetical protein